MQRVMGIWVVLGAALAMNVQASNARQECEEMYPAESYSAEDRSFYINECLQAYGVNSGVQQDYESAQDEDVGYYEGTVEDYVESVPYEEDSENAE